MSAPTAAQVFRDYATDGVPSSGKNKVKKSEARAWGTWLESFLSSIGGSGGLIYSSKAAMDADLAHAANSMAWVTGDGTAANNGVYQKLGASGSGSWTRLADLPYSFIVATDTGDGTPNAIQATTDIPVSASALILMTVADANTGSPVTVSFNGGAALTIKSNSGNDISAGGLAAGMQVLGVASDTTFRLVTDQVSSSIVAAAEAAADAAEAAAASLNLPALVSGDEGKSLVVKSDLSGYEIGYGGAELFNQMITYFSSISMETAELSPVAIAAGPDGNGLFDGFNALTYVDTAGSSGLDTGTAGQLKPVVGADTSERSATSDGTSNFTGFTIGDQGWSIDNNKTVKGISFSTTDVIAGCRLLIVKRTSAGVYDVIFTSDPFTTVGGGFTTVTLPTPFAVPATGNYYVAAYITVAGAVTRILSGSRFSLTGLASGTGVAMTEATASQTPVTQAIYQGAVSALTTQSVPLNLSSAPDWARLFAIVKKNGAVVNTDLTFKISRNGSDFLTLPLAEKFARPDGTVLLDSGVVDITSIASGVVGKWQAITANSKAPSIYAVGVMFGVN